MNEKLTILKIIIQILGIVEKALPLFLINQNHKLRVKVAKLRTDLAKKTLKEAVEHIEEKTYEENEGKSAADIIDEHIDAASNGDGE